MENERKNLSLHDGSVGVGGIYNEVKINDRSTLNGDIDCIILNCSDCSEIEGNVLSSKTHLCDGSKINGDVKGELVHINDGSSIIGNLEVEDLILKDGSCVSGNVKTAIAKISDSSKINGDLNAEDSTIKDGSTITGNIFSTKIHLYDGCKITESIKGEEIKINDSVKVGKDCECEKFNGSDCFHIAGLLNAEEINITLDGNCSIKEIGGNNISVRVPKNSNSISILGIVKINANIGYLTSDTIEGDTIYLENTTAKIVRGTKIVIGDGCKIDKIEYKENLNISEKSVINQKIKTN